MASAHVILKKIKQRSRVAVSREEVIPQDSKSDLPLVVHYHNQLLGAPHSPPPSILS